MREYKFIDPQINDNKTYNLENYKLTIPHITEKNLGSIINKISYNANNYCDNDIPNSIEDCFDEWVNPDSKFVKKWLKSLAELTDFSEQTVYIYGIYPLKKIDLDIEKIKSIPDNLKSLIETNKYKSFTQWENGFIKGYGVPNIKEYPDPRLILLILAGNVIGSSWLSLIMGYILKCPQIIKLSHKDIGTFMIFLETLSDIDPKFRKTISCGYYSSSEKVNKLAIKKSDIVMAMGSDETIRSINSIIKKGNPDCRFIPHGHKVGFQIISKEYSTKEVAELAAWGIISHDQNACFTPMNIFLEMGGQLSVNVFAEYLGDTMEKLAYLIPPKNTIDAAEKIKTFREEQMQRKLLGENIIILSSKNLNYTIIIDYENSMLIPTSQERTVIIKPIDNIYKISENIKHMRKYLETVGIAVRDENLIEISEELSSAGVTNIKSIGSEYILSTMDNHDGLFNTALANMNDGLRWVNINYTKIDKDIEENLRFKSDSIESLENVISK